MLIRDALGVADEVSNTLEARGHSVIEACNELSALENAAETGREIVAGLRNHIRDSIFAVVEEYRAMGSLNMQMVEPVANVTFESISKALDALSQSLSDRIRMRAERVNAENHDRELRAAQARRAQQKHTLELVLTILKIIAVSGAVTTTVVAILQQTVAWVSGAAASALVAILVWVLSRKRTDDDDLV